MKTSVHKRKRIEHLKNRKREKNRALSIGLVPALSESETKALLTMYKDPSYTTAQIARRFGICAATVTNAVKRAGQSLRQRGRWRQLAPPLAVQEVLLEAWTDSYENAATRCGISKQRVAVIVGRWSDWAISQFGPRQVNPSKSPARSSHFAGSQRGIVPKACVISFRVSPAVVNKLEKRSLKCGSESSPNLIARSLLLECLGTELAENDLNPLG